MKLPLALMTICLAMALGQQVDDCPIALLRTDDCADVINPNACYNEFRFTSARTLQCIDGKDDKDRARKARTACVGATMCNWVKTNKFCGS
ncbi:hypothetical protein B0T22DRAFT_483117 [Podospora appendiculata]|uniref:Uncharacterized protein n=1 Tax=Podospora appendiculata TaxID=314037 RepID=A0AAE0X7H5_9PEZI|nr:hypothetical protein B0T22DRAFT_483117 [Podospora appendiculata]